MLKTSMKLGAVLAAALAAVPAHAAGGNGIRVGGSEGRLHPFLELELRSDSNVMYQYAGGAVGDLILHVRPGLKLEIPSETLAIDGVASLDWTQFLGNDDPATKDLSNLFADARIGLGFNRSGSVGFEVQDEFRRSDRPMAFSIPSGVVSNFNALTVRAPFRPGGGALTLGVNGGWLLETYEAALSGVTCNPVVDPLCDTSKLSKAGYNQLQGGADVRWRFLPRTEATLGVALFSRMPSDNTISYEVSGLRADAGVTGLVTAHLAATLKVGYGTTLSVSGPGAGAAAPSVSTWLANLSAEWIPTDTATVKLTYGHDFGADPGITYALYQTNRVALDGHIQLAGRFGLGASAGWDRVDYQAVSASTDILRFSPVVDAEVLRWLRAEVAYAYSSRSSSGGGTASLPAFEYGKHEAWLKVVATY